MKKLVFLFLLLSATALAGSINNPTGGTSPGGGPLVLLGTSTSATNPQRSGDPTTGLYSSSSGLIQLGCSGANCATASSLGLGIGLGTNVPINTGDFGGAVAIGTSYAGVSTAPANSLIVQNSIGIGTTNPSVALTVYNPNGNPAINIGFSDSFTWNIQRSNSSLVVTEFGGSGGATFNDGGGFTTAGIISTGTKFTISGCSVSATSGGATVGTYTSGTTGACTVVITMNGATGLTAPNGWSCDANDRTTVADLQHQTATTATTATISGTTVSGDVINFKCSGY